MTQRVPLVDDWDRHWDDYSTSAGRNPAQRMRRQLIDSLLELGDGPARVVDIGCGQGDLLRYLAQLHPQVELLGIDFSRAGLAAAAAKVPAARFHLHDLTARSAAPAELAGWATHAVCSEVLEHVDDPSSFLRNAASYLAPRGRLVVTVPGGPMSAFDRHIGHRRHFTSDALAQVISDGGLRVQVAAGAGFPVFNLYRRLVILRGRALIRDVEGQGATSGTLLSRMVMRMFDSLFAIGGRDLKRGWQIHATAQKC